MSLFKGCGVAMVTPFDRNCNIDCDVLGKYVDFLLDGGAAALLPFGTTGEPATVTPEEYENATRFIIKRVNRRVPVIVGTGSNSTATAVRHTADAKRFGADAALVVTPYYNKCTQRGILEHYKAVADVGLPVIAYNVPTRTCVNIAPATVEKLAAIDGIAGIKEASGDIDQFQAVAEICDKTGFELYCGDDSLTTIAMALGASGIISVAANPAPREMAELCALCERGDYAAARALQFKLSAFIHALFCEVNPIPAKKAMQLIGIDVGAPRLPLTEIEPEHAIVLENAMRAAGVLK